MVMDGEGSAPAPSRKEPAVRSHSEAERKRRQRINTHLATLRTLVPAASRMDKAALLGEVVRHVRELRATASDAIQGVGVVPGESDEVGVVEEDGDSLRRPDHHRYGGAGAYDDDDGRPGHGRPRRVRAWVCCADRPGLLSDLGRAVRSVRARPVRAEIATVGGRTRGVLLLDICGCGDDAGTDGGRRAVALSTLRAALHTVLLDRAEHLDAGEAYGKRPRFSAQISQCSERCPAR